jgi:nicotinamidase-related amidase
MASSQSVYILALLALCSAYKDGAPDSSEICRSMKPGHKLAPQAVAAPFDIIVDKTSYSRGEVIHGKLFKFL